MIGIFDSGIGGLTVARSIEQHLPESSILYFGDTARTPYGTKSKEVIIDYSLRNAEFLLEKGATLIVIGCNSASSVATQTLRNRFDVPIFEVIGPAATHALKMSKTGRIGIIGTRATITSNIYETTLSTLKADCIIHSVACPLLVPLVEEGWLNRQETKMILRRYLYPLKHKKIDTLILGCTHYPLLKDLIQARIGKKTILIDSSIETAKQLRKYIQINKHLINEKEKPQHQFYFSDITASARSIAGKIFGRSMELLPS